MHFLSNLLSPAAVQEAKDRAAQEKQWNDKRLFLEDLSSKIKNGSRIYIGNFAATAQAAIRAIVDDVRLVDIEILQLYPGGELPHIVSKGSSSRIRTSAFFGFCETASSLNEGSADYIPASAARFPRLLEERGFQIDVAIIKVTPPNSDGYVNLGIGVDVTTDILKHAKMVIAEVTTHMPWTSGSHSQIPCDKIDWWVYNDVPLGAAKDLFPTFYKDDMKRVPDDTVMNALGKQLVKEIPNGATIQFAFNVIAMSVLPFLKQRKDLGIHTDMIGDITMHLIQDGIINNSKKEIHPGKTIISNAMGSPELYKWLHNNPTVEFHPVSYINDPQVMKQKSNVVSIMVGKVVDVTGQVSMSSVKSIFNGGIGSAIDSLRGAALSPGGKPIIALPSKSSKGYSNIVFSMPRGTSVDVTAADVEYVVTEYGSAYLFGKTIRERCLALINIAHPEFRQSLLEEAKAHHYIPMEQPGQSFKIPYPEEWECIHTTKMGKMVLIRPIKATDEDQLRDFFHHLSDQSVYMRYFRKIKSLPQRILRKTADIDYSTNMAIVALYPPDNAHGEIIGLGQWIAHETHNNSNNNIGGFVNAENDFINSNGHDHRQEKLSPPPEIAFQVRDDWQGNGLGKFFFLRLAELSKGEHKEKVIYRKCANSDNSLSLQSRPFCFSFNLQI